MNKMLLVIMSPERRVKKSLRTGYIGRLYHVTFHVCFFSRQHKTQLCNPVSSKEETKGVCYYPFPGCYQPLAIHWQCVNKKIFIWGIHLKKIK